MNRDKEHYTKIAARNRLVKLFLEAREILEDNTCIKNKKLMIMIINYLLYLMDWKNK